MDVPTGLEMTIRASLVRLESGDHLYPGWGGVIRGARPRSQVSDLVPVVPALQGRERWFEVRLATCVGLGRGKTRLLIGQTDF